MDKKAQKRIDLLSKKINDIQQRLAGARKQMDDPSEVANSNPTSPPPKQKSKSSKPPSRSRLGDNRRIEAIESLMRVVALKDRVKNAECRQQAAIWFALAVSIATSATCANAQPWELWQINADGGGLRRFVDTPDYTCGSPDWSPDGKLIAYDTWRVGEPLQASQIAVIRADGTHRKLIGLGAMPSWSPDGTQIVCHNYKPESLVVMNADGSGRETISGHWGSPRWSPRGNRIASILNSNIALYDLATGTESRILRGPYAARQGFAISPDGLHFCFGDMSGGIAVALLDEQSMSASCTWLSKNGICHCASWAPDGKRVVAGWQPSGSKMAQLCVFSVGKNDPPVLLKGQDPARNNYNPDWSPDGKTIVFACQAPANTPH